MVETIPQKSEERKGGFESMVGACGLAVIAEEASSPLFCFVSVVPLTRVTVPCLKVRDCHNITENTKTLLRDSRACATLFNLMVSHPSPIGEMRILFAVSNDISPQTTDSER